MQKQSLVHTPTRTPNRDQKNVTTTREKSDHSPIIALQHPENSIFGGHDDLPDQMRYTTTYR